MKKFFFIPFLCLSLAGCQVPDQSGQQLNNASITDLQTQISDLHSQLTALQEDEIDTSNRAHHVQEDLWTLQRAVDTNNFLFSTQNAPAANQSPSSGDGTIPADVDAKIRSDAANEFPDNYVMQNAAVQAQESAYRQLHP